MLRRILLKVSTGCTSRDVLCNILNFLKSHFKAFKGYLFYVNLFTSMQYSVCVVESSWCVVAEETR